MEILSIAIVFFLLNSIYCPPVPNPKKTNENDLEFEKLLNSIDYGTYLSQVMNELQNDDEFSKNVNDANNTEAISEALNYVSPKIRSKLDELKRVEILRLNKLQKEVDKRKLNGNHPHEMPLPPVKSVDISHLDDINPESFNPEDLKRLIDRTKEVFEQIDVKNDENYKYHEMEKEAKKRAELERSIADSKLRKEAQARWVEEQKTKHSQHKRINEPGSVEQLKTVWRVDDNMNDDSFNPKTFFYLHDVNGDGNLDVAELETLMQRELDKAYDLNDNSTDIIERYHEMNRMRKRFLKHVDTDNNHLVSLEEFTNWAKSDAANQGKSWKTQEELEPFYSQEEFDAFYSEYVSRHPDLQHAPILTTPNSVTPSQPPSQ